MEEGVRRGWRRSEEVMERGDGERGKEGLMADCWTEVGGTQRSEIHRRTNEGKQKENMKTEMYMYLCCCKNRQTNR